MSHQLHLYVTSLVNAQEAFDDECEDGDKHDVLIEVPGNVIALLWIPLFKDVIWQKVLDKEQWEDAEEDDSKEDYFLRMPFVEVNSAIENLRYAEPNISEYFKENGGVSNLVNELIEVLKNTKYKFVYFSPTCGDFCYSRDEDRELVEKVLAISNGDFSEDRENIAKIFQLQLKNKNTFNSKAIKFLSSKEVFSEDREYVPVDAGNVYSLAGMLDEVC